MCSVSACTLSSLAVQELMLILEELWEQTPALRGVPIYQASGQAKRALSIFQTYIEMMNDDIRRAFKVSFMSADGSRHLIPENPLPLLAAARRS